MLLLTLVCADQTVNIEIHSGSTPTYTDFTESGPCSGYISDSDIINYPAGKPAWAYNYPYGFTNAQSPIE